MPKKSGAQKGFTLIELLITISIIAILSTIGLVVYSLVLKKGNDSKREADLRTIQSALEQYYNDQFFYPTTAGLTALLSASPPPAFTNCIGNTYSSPCPKTYLNSPPQDPKGTYPYKYEAFASISRNACDNSGTKCNIYCLYAVLENPPSPVPGAPLGCEYPAGYNFALTLP